MVITFAGHAGREGGKGKINEGEKEEINKILREGKRKSGDRRRNATMENKKRNADCSRREKRTKQTRKKWYLRSIVQTKTKWKMSLPDRDVLLDFGKI
jgi:hypothetical protein